MAQPPGTPVQPGPTTPLPFPWPLSLSWWLPVQPPSPPMLAPLLLGAGPAASSCPPQSLCPQLTNLLREDLVKCHLSPVLQVLLHDAADAGDTVEGLSHAPRRTPAPRPSSPSPPVSPSPMAYTSYHPVCPHPSMARCWVAESQRVPRTGAQGRVGMSIPPKKAPQVSGSEGTGGHRVWQGEWGP